MTETDFSGRWKRSLKARWREGFIPWAFERKGKRLFKPASPRQIKALRIAGRLVWVRAGNRAHTYIVTGMDDAVITRKSTRAEVWDFVHVWTQQGLRQVKYLHEKVEPLPPKRRRRRAQPKKAASTKAAKKRCPKKEKS